MGLVGYGYCGLNLLRNFMELPEARVTWVCERQRERLAQALARFPAVRGTRDFSELLHGADLDAILIATPISTHYPLAKAGLEAGKHVFVEKPMTASAAESRALAGLADQGKLTLMVGHTVAYSPPVRKVKTLLESGDLGRILLPHGLGGEPGAAPA